MSTAISEHDVTVLHGDVREQLATLPDESANCVVTSPPYFGLRDYGADGQIGLEASPAEYVEQLRSVFAETRRVLSRDGTLWLNLGDSYARGDTGQGNSGPTSKLEGGTRPSFRNDKASVLPRRRVGGLPNKSLLMMPERVVMALLGDAWILRNKIVWRKPNAMPESVRDRLVNKWEHLFLLTRSENYWFDQDALGRHRGDVWDISTTPYAAAHFACFPAELPRRCILAGCPDDGVVLDPFAGSGTTLKVARSLGRKSIGIELNAAYIDIIRDRIGEPTLDFGEAS